MIYGGYLTRVAYGLAAFLILAVVHSKEKCSRSCIAQNCNIVAIRYGKYCGIGYFGCPGEAPCDDLDKCCMTHDNCVDIKGMTYVHCHKEFQRCVNEVNTAMKQSNGQKVGFSTQCPYSRAIPTMYKGMDYGIFFSKIGNVLKPPAVLKPVVEANLGQIKADTKDGLGTIVPLLKKGGSKVSAFLN